MQAITFGSSKNIVKSPPVVADTSPKRETIKSKVSLSTDELEAMIASGEDLNVIRNTKPEDLFDETNVGAHTIYKQSEYAIAVRDENNLCKFYQYRDGRWVNRFDVGKSL